MANPMNELIDLFEKLPGVGVKTAQRYVTFILKESSVYAMALGSAITKVKKDTKTCSVCHAYSTDDCCEICVDKHSRRDALTICVVKDNEDMQAIELVGSFKGVYHVLHGLIDPMSGVGPDDIKLKELITRLMDVKELILALDSSVEAEATSLYIKKILKAIPDAPKVTRIGFGLSVGTGLNYADRLTIEKALESRNEF